MERTDQLISEEFDQLTKKEIASTEIASPEIEQSSANQITLPQPPTPAASDELSASENLTSAQPVGWSSEQIGPVERVERIEPLQPLAVEAISIEQQFNSPQELAVASTDLDLIYQPPISDLDLPYPSLYQGQQGQLGQPDNADLIDLPEAVSVSADQAEPASTEVATEFEPQVEPSQVELPVLTPMPVRPQLAMPQYYLKTDNLQKVRGYLPTDDLQIEVMLPEKESSKVWLWFSEIRSVVRDFMFAALTAVLIVVFVVQPVKVEGTSMLPKLHDGERIFINKFVYSFDSIQRGDIVVFWYPKNPSQSFIKRVIGIPGDEIRITNGKLFINNKLVPEPYLSPEYTANVSPNRYWLVEEHHYFVMGDNRDASNDSRSWGQVPEKYIYGKAVFRYWPLDKAGTLN